MRVHEVRVWVGVAGPRYSGWALENGVVFFFVVFHGSCDVMFCSNPRTTGTHACVRHQLVFSVLAKILLLNSVLNLRCPPTCVEHLPDRWNSDRSAAPAYTLRRLCDETLPRVKYGCCHHGKRMLHNLHRLRCLAFASLSQRKRRLGKSWKEESPCHASCLIWFVLSCACTCS